MGPRDIPFGRTRRSRPSATRETLCGGVVLRVDALVLANVMTEMPVTWNSPLSYRGIIIGSNLLCGVRSGL